MGYTHYWKSGGFTPEQWRTLQFAARVIVKRSNAEGATLAGWSGHGKPEISAKAIRLNGADPQDFETFTLEPDARTFNFCKTGHRPYDAAVVALLTVAARINPRFTWTSDGEPDEHAAGHFVGLRFKRITSPGAVARLGRAAATGAGFAIGA